MRGLRFIVLLAFVVMLGGCASSSTTGVCAHARDLRGELAWPSFQESSLRHKSANAAPYREPGDVTVLGTAKNETPELRFTSTEWWMRENARLARATMICRGCAPAVVPTASSKPADLMLHSDIPIPEASMSGVEGSGGVGGPQQP
jgi:hypothetical protein